MQEVFFTKIEKNFENNIGDLVKTETNLKLFRLNKQNRERSDSMKRILILLTTALLLCGCTRSTEGGSQTVPAVTQLTIVPDNRFGVALQTEELTADGCTLICTRTDDSAWEVYTGADFAVQKLIDGQYQPCPPAGRTDVEWCWTAEAYIISHERPTVWQLNWNAMYGTLPEGRYRLLKTFNGTLDHAPNERFAVYVEFEVSA